MSKITNKHMAQYPPRPSVEFSDLVSAIWQCKEGEKWDWREPEKADLIADAFFYTGHGDGYEIAMNLKGSDNEVCREEMESLDLISDLYYSVQSKLEAEWVKTNNIQPPYSPGTEVVFWSGHEQKTGVINKVYQAMRHSAKYLIDVHPLQGKPIISFENVQSVQDMQAEQGEHP